MLAKSLIKVGEESFLHSVNFLLLSASASPIWFSTFYHLWWFLYLLLWYLSTDLFKPFSCTKQNTGYWWKIDPKRLCSLYCGKLGQDFQFYHHFDIYIWARAVTYCWNENILHFQCPWFPKCYSLLLWVEFYLFIY